MESTFKFYQITSLDVWGNETDGYELNAAYNTGKYVIVHDDADERALKSALTDYCGYNCDYDTVEDFSEYHIYMRESMDSDTPDKPYFQAIRDTDKEAEGITPGEIAFIVK